MSVEHVLFPLLRAGLYGGLVDAEIADSIDTATLHELYTVSNAHDIAHVLGVALAKCGKLGEDEVSKNFRRRAVMAVSRYERIRYDLQTVCDALEQAGIPFIPLKGSVLRAYYPEPWMRNSCDIDILVHKEDLDAATQVLLGSLGYTLNREGKHDICFISQCRIHIELHFDLIEDGWANSACNILKDIWDYAVPKEPYKFHHMLSDDMFYYYHIAHMAKHFEQGGCGIRSFFDLWFLDNIEDADYLRRDELLRRGDLLKFSQAARKLAKVWLEGASHNRITWIMEDYVIRGGIFGSATNKIAIQQKEEGGRLQYTVFRIFPPYDVLKHNFPILVKHPWLTPFIYVYRWFRVIFDGRVPNSLKELSYSQSISKTQMQQFKEFFKELGL